MPWFLPLVTTALGALASGLSSASKNKEQRANLNRAVGELRGNLLTQEDIDALLNKNSRAFNVSLTNLLNTTAIRTRGTANAPVVAGAIASGMEAQKQQSNVQLEQSALDRNAQISSQIASLEAGAPVNTTGEDAFAGGIGGLAAGIELNKMLTFEDKMNPVAAATSNVSGDISNTGLKSPALNIPSQYTAQDEGVFSKLFKFGPSVAGSIAGTTGTAGTGNGKTGEGNWSPDWGLGEYDQSIRELTDPLKFLRRKMKAYSPPATRGPWDTSQFRF